MDGRGRRGEREGDEERERAMRGERETRGEREREDFKVADGGCVLVLTGRSKACSLGSGMHALKSGA